VTRGYLLLLGLAGVAAFLVGGWAGASHNTYTHVSAGSNTEEPPQFVGASADGTRVYLRTRDALAPATDTDVTYDIYERRSDGTTTHISRGPAGGNAQSDVTFGDVSANGTRVFFESFEPLVATDTDDCVPSDPNPNGCRDVYAYENGATTIVSTGPAGGNGAWGADFEHLSEDGARAFFSSQEQLVSADTDSARDVYQRAGGTTTLISTGPAGGNGSSWAAMRGSSADGTRVFFTTEEQLVTADTDSSGDVYERAGGTTTLVSTGPAGGNGAIDAAFRAASRDGSRVMIETAERLVSSDTDSRVDVYERSGSTTTLLSTGPTGGNGAHDSDLKGWSTGGTRIFFHTAERLVSSDTDSRVDVYERSGSTTTLLSTGPAGGNGAFDALLQDVSADGSRAVISTGEPLVSSDTDTRLDVYERSGSTTTLLSTGPQGGNGAFDVFYSGASEDGTRVFFETAEQLASDTDTFQDVYERHGGVTTRLSSSSGGNGAQNAVPVGASKDGARVFFASAEQLAASDTDAATDIFEAIATPSGYARPKGATPARFSLVPAYEPCTSPDRVHGPPVLGGGSSDGSCNPPVPESDHLTVGTADSNDQPTKFVGSANYATVVGNPGGADEADVRLALDLEDVRRKSDLGDYTGEVQVNAAVQITDKFNGASGTEPGTVTGLDFPFKALCAATLDTTVGSTCAVTTSADAVTPGAVPEGARTIWQLSAVVVFDGGADGLVATAPNTLFARQGIFIP
jgi:hypothetical protein